MTNQKRKACIAVLFTYGVAAFASIGIWPRFSSSTHFSVTYPKTWFRIGISPDRLQILSSKGGAEGVVIKRGQAEITVLMAQGGSTKTISRAIRYYTEGSSILSGRTILENRPNGSCVDIQEVISKEAAIASTDASVPVPDVINTDFFVKRMAGLS